MTVNEIRPMEAPAASEIVNISCYKFVDVMHPDEYRTVIRQRAVELGLKGTVLLSHEGINLFVAGPVKSIDAFVEFLRTLTGFSDLQPKISRNSYQPFNRMLVKVKKEIISFGIDGVVPAERTSPKLSAAELRRWLDEGRRVHLLDTRNDYEYELGTFENAIRLGIDHFREFPAGVSRLPESMKNEPVVMFCTGGIRCEKAGPFMEMAGFREVYQLDGGILKYFEEVGGAHYHGECFVFDQRVAVNPALCETSTTQCYACQAVVTADQQESPQYVPGKSCPACYREPAQVAADLLESRSGQIQSVTSPLPGSDPCLNRRPLNVPGRCAGRTLLTFLTDVHPQVGHDEWMRRIQESRVVPAKPVRRRRPGNVPEPTLPLNPDHVVREGERFDLLEPMSVEPDVSADIRVLFEDDEFIVLHKPAPLPVHASGRFNRNTLRHILNLVWFPCRPHVVHRLDANTSGVMVLCKRKRIASIVQKQFEQRTVRKRYLTLVHGHPPESQFRCDNRLSRQPGEGGIRTIDPEGDDAITHFEVLRHHNQGTTLLQVFPETGRTNQIRAHLWNLGYPIVGDPAYLRDGKLGSNRTLETQEPPMCLHAAELTFQDHTGAERRFESPPPTWAEET